MTRADENPSAAEDVSEPPEPRRAASRFLRKDGSCSSNSPKLESASATKMAATTIVAVVDCSAIWKLRSEEHTSELQSLMRTSYAVFCLKKKKKDNIQIIAKSERHNNT